MKLNLVFTCLLFTYSYVLSKVLKMKRSQKRSLNRCERQWKSNDHYETGDTVVHKGICYDYSKPTSHSNSPKERSNQKLVNPVPDYKVQGTWNVLRTVALEKELVENTMKEEEDENLTCKANMASYKNQLGCRTQNWNFENNIVKDQTNQTLGEYKYNVKNGIVKFDPSSENSKAIQRSTMVPLKNTSISMNFNDYPKKSQLRRILKIFNSTSDTDANPLFDLIFPERNPNMYSFKNLVRAFASFPFFCNDHIKGDSASEDELLLNCKIELSTLFAHFKQEVGGLRLLNEGNCIENAVSGNNCSTVPTYRECCNTDQCLKNYPCIDNVSYFGRGALQCSHPYIYGPFSRLLCGNSKLFVAQPQIVSTAKFYAILEGLWFYMTPSNPKPSMHDVMVGFWQPSSAEIQKGWFNGFGTTINIINGNQECFNGSRKQEAFNRGTYYKEVMKKFNIEDQIGDESKLNCQSQNSVWISGSKFTDWSGNINMYWDENYSYEWDGGKKMCNLGYWYTPFPANVEGSYQDCVVSKYGSTSTGQTFQTNVAKCIENTCISNTTNKKTETQEEEQMSDSMEPIKIEKKSKNSKATIRIKTSKK